MSRILITSGPTRQYLDPVRFISNSSSGKMGSCLVDAALAAGHKVVLVTGPATVEYASSIDKIEVQTTSEMLDACLEQFERCDGMIGAAAPCDYQPVAVANHKLKKSGEPLSIQLIETPDIVATLGKRKQPGQWTVGFALETEDVRFRAIVKLQKKLCDLVVSNSAEAINSDSNTIEILDSKGQVAWAGSGTKKEIAREIIRVVQERLISAAKSF